jgi:hypothetical protein
MARRTNLTARGWADASRSAALAAALATLSAVAVGRLGATHARPIEDAAYADLEAELLAHPHVDAVFLGSSRVAAAVDVEAFDDEARRATGETARSVNFGLAYSTMATRYFWLRNLLQRYPQRLRGVTLFVELPGGLPDSFATWHDPWYHPARPAMVTPLLERGDLTRVWTQNAGLEDSLSMTLAFATRDATWIRRREGIGRELLARGGEMTLGFMLPFVGAAPAQAPPADLAARGGIRVDALGVARARAAARTANEGDEGEPRRIRAGAVLADIVALAKGAGWRVVFFDMPLHSIHAKDFATDVRRRDIAAFEQQARAWGACRVTPELATGDDDFPDIWHLRRSLAPAWSHALFHAWHDSDCAGRGDRPQPPGI